MPIYEYTCPNGHSEEKIDLKREYANTPTIICGQCGQIASKQVSNSNWQFGSGPKESNVSRAIGNVRKAEREGRL
jgi:predicted nucleic acid-binding Zn ribbon protein